MGMMHDRRTSKVNSNLQRVIAQVILQKVKNPNMKSFVTVLRVEATKDLRDAKVFVSLMGDDESNKKTFKAIVSAGGFIQSLASKAAPMRFFPDLHFVEDSSAKHYEKISRALQEEQLKEIKQPLN